MKYKVHTELSSTVLVPCCAVKRVFTTLVAFNLLQTIKWSLSCDSTVFFHECFCSFKGFSAGVLSPEQQLHKHRWSHVHTVLFFSQTQSATWFTCSQVTATRARGQSSQSLTEFKSQHLSLPQTLHCPQWWKVLSTFTWVLYFQHICTVLEDFYLMLFSTILHHISGGKYSTVFYFTTLIQVIVLLELKQSVD